MKKIKFLNGMSAIFAFAAVALATTFTSCEKEEFNVKFEPSPAKIYFTPSVIDAATNADVTKDATFEGAGEITGNKSISAGEVTITATVKGVTGSVKVQYPAVEAGQVVAISPVILLSSEFETAVTSKLTGNVNKVMGDCDDASISHMHGGNKWAENASDYFYPYTATYKNTAKAVKEKEEIYVTSVALNKAIAAYEVEVEKEFTADLKASAWCLFNAEFTAEEAEFEVVFSSKVNGEEVAKVIYTHPSYAVTAENIEMAFPGHEHAYEHGHGHGNNPNAGGGIVFGD